MPRPPWLAAAVLLPFAVAATRAAPPAGTADDPIVDSAMTEAEAFDGLDRRCPKSIRDRQAVVPVTYYGFDGRVYRGQIVVDREVADDVRAVFAAALKEKFPVRSVVPISHPKFRKNDVWDDNLSMDANNTSAFNYRLVAGTVNLSNHATGRAIDLNPFTNPYVRRDRVSPAGATYDPKVPGTLTPDHPVTKAFLARGWEWGGHWVNPDYQHFQKPLPGGTDPAPEAMAEWLTPRALRPGDTVAIVVPASPAKAGPVKEYAAQLEKAGYVVRLPADLDRADGYLAGSDDVRAAELNAAIRDSKVRAIFAARGGYGLTRILDRIDYEALRRDPKIIAGYSDLTGLHLAIARKARVVSFHSPMPLSSLYRDGPEFGFAAAGFRRTLFADQYPKGEAGFTVAVPPESPPAKLVGGKARGRLVGGNLSLVSATVGTPYGIEPAGKILFLEDVNEAPYRVDRMLSQLRLAGVLDSVAGVVLGQFTQDDPKGDDAAATEKVLREYFGRLKVPVLMNFPVGHVPRNATLPHGGIVELDADVATLRVTANPVRVD